ncbi:MAG: hypothetical protein NMNS01_13150 [Nitrosomonas sp.]|nr:MAG: hypothetical protein NMNS01_13150 [Nitrosomonas sp.]
MKRNNLQEKESNLIYLKLHVMKSFTGYKFTQTTFTRTGSNSNKKKVIIIDTVVP